MEAKGKETAIVDKKKESFILYWSSKCCIWIRVHLKHWILIHIHSGFNESGSITLEGMYKLIPVPQ